MNTYHQNSWKNTIAFRISFDLRNLNIHQTHPALLHFAEHLMFVATKRFNEQSLYEKKTLYFDFLGAFTTPLYLCINVTCARSDLKIITEILREMIYSWTCSEKQFNKEKEEILVELANFNNELTTQAVNTLSEKDPEFKTIAIGSKKTLTNLGYSDLKKIKEAWKIMLEKAPASLVVASGRLNTSEKKLLEDITNLKKPQLTAPTIPFSSQFFSVKNTHAIQFKSISSSPFYLLLQRAYFVRWTNFNPNWDFEFVREENSLNYIVYPFSKKEVSVETAKKFLLAPPSKSEFTAARDIVTKYLGSLQDGLEPQNVIDWLHTFSTFPELKNKNLATIAKLFSSYQYSTFQKEWNAKIKK